MCLSITTIGNFILSKIETAKYPPPGKIYEVNGSKIHLNAKGEGSPTVLFTCGFGSPSAYTDFYLLQQRVSQITRTCIYERPGYGWSEKTDRKRSTNQIVEDLDILLEKANEKPPYLLVGHGEGAMEVLLYASKYPQKVWGVILVDGTSTYRHKNYPEKEISKYKLRVLDLLKRIGLLRVATELGLIHSLKKRIESTPVEFRKITKAMVYKNYYSDVVLKESEMLYSEIELLEKQLDLIDIPLMVLTAEDSLKKTGWKKSQESLLNLSTNSKHIIILGADHHSIHLKHSGQIVSAIKEQINKTKYSQTLIK